MSRYSGRPFAALLAALVLVSTGAACAVEEEVADLEEIETFPLRVPIVLVPGCAPPPLTNAQGAAVMNSFRDFFLAKGYPASYVNVFVLPGATCHSIVDWGAELGAFVNQVRAATGRYRVDIVAHSMGPMGARWFVQNGGRWVVRNFVQLSGANHGSHIGLQLGMAQDVFGFPSYQAAKEMYPPYACQGESTTADVQFNLNGCLTPTGRTVWRDETPYALFSGEQLGFIRYLNIWNPLDEIIQPPTSSCLNQDFVDDCSDPVNEEWVVEAAPPIIAHQKILSDVGVQERVYDFITFGH
jgi:hypothetical protein